MPGTASLILALAAAQAAQPAPIEGLWKNPIGSAIIAVAPCGNALCGKVVWASARGQREVAKTTSNVVGTTVLTAVKPKGKGWAGQLFIPDDNIHVSAKLQLWLKHQAAKRRQAAEDAKLWQVALNDARVMADISRAMSSAAAVRNLKTYF